MLKKLSSNLSIKSIFIILLTIIFTVVPFYNILIKGVYRWHITQPEFWQGGLEILIFIFFSFILSYKCENKMNTILLVFGAIYLSMNGVIIPFVTVYIYFEILLYIGFTVLNLKKEECVGKINENFIAGISIWGMFAIICSLLKHGGFNDLRIMTAVLLILCIILNNKKKYSNSLFNSFNDFINKNKLNNLSKFSIIILTFLVLALVAKSNTTQDYDSLWYGLRPEQVLIGVHSFYDYLGYSAFVYYYPKLMELLFLPISNIGDYSFIITGNIFIYILLIVSLYRVLNNMFKNMNKNNNYKFNLITWIVLIIVTIPAITGITTTGKPDILGTLLTISAFMFFFEFVSNKKIELFILSLLSLLLVTGVKIVYIVWGGLLFLAIVCTIALLIYKKEINIHNFKTKNLIPIYLITICGMVFILGIHYRTLKLTGYPLYPTFLTIFQALGFKGLYTFGNVTADYGNLPIRGGGYILNQLYQLFFDPNKLGHVIMLWTSSILPFILLVFLLCFKKNTVKRNIFITFFNVIVGSGFLYIFIFQEVPDGNYFIAPIIMLLLILISNIYINHRFGTNKIVIFIIIMFICLQTPILFVSSPSWQIGTKPFSKVLIKTNFETKSFNENNYRNNGYYNIANYISTNMKEKRIISSYIDLTIINRIDGQIEAFAQIQSAMLSDSNITANYENFYKYLTHAKINGFLLLNEDKSLFKEYVQRFIKENGYTQKIDDEKAVFYVISAEDYIVPVRIDSDNIWEDGWLPKESNFKMYTGENGSISVNGYYPFEITNNLTGTIYINEVPNKFEITQEHFVLELPAPKNLIATVKIKCDFDKKPSNQDQRMISFVLKELKAK